MPSDGHPVAIRVPANGVVRRNVEPEKDYGKTLNRYEVSHRGEKVAILGLGSFISWAKLWLPG